MTGKSARITRWTTTLLLYSQYTACNLFKYQCIYTLNLYSTGFDLQVAVAILRTPEGLDCTSLLTDLEDRDYILNTLGSSLNRSSSTSRNSVQTAFDIFSSNTFA